MVLAAVRPGTGYENRANDVAALHSQLVRFEGTLVERQLMTSDRIAKFGAMTKALLKPLSDSNDVMAAKKLHDQTFSYFIESWTEVHLRFVIERAGEDVELPKLYG